MYIPTQYSVTERAEIYAFLHAHPFGMIVTHDGEREHAVRWDALSEPVKRQMNGVVGFRIDITDMQATFKLSQNRNDVDHERIVSELEKQDEPIADVMRQHRKS